MVALYTPVCSLSVGFKLASTFMLTTAELLLYFYGVSQYCITYVYVCLQDVRIKKHPTLRMKHVHCMLITPTPQL